MRAGWRIICRLDFLLHSTLFSILAHSLSARVCMYTHIVYIDFNYFSKELVSAPQPPAPRPVGRSLLGAT